MDPIAQCIHLLQPGIHVGEPVGDHFAGDLADRGLRVIVAGLDQDFSRQPFGPMPRLLALAEMVDKMHAVCVRCGGPAHYSQRISGGSSQILVGDTDSYEARCRRCYEPYAG